MRSQMNFLPNAVAIVFAGSTSSQCKIRHHTLIGVRKRSASAVCHSWRVSEALGTEKYLKSTGRPAFASLAT
jgi:hypothetical protein